MMVALIYVASPDSLVGSRQAPKLSLLVTNSDDGVPSPRCFFDHLALAFERQSRRHLCYLKARSYVLRKPSQ
ncbi:hypothetical protein CONPUDRAFT_81496 [Coniophora puteana RWD-64-598 SS2]|uniref:Uncharacterized protein n=1 Tax=Coniophora puteana (strain RWD-64-598) TaxID=741705 RepID=A0A5M3MSY1_CONPW|nr:uncharacterized protein CONPUDRAFT_81496 [Coniophora puteana RWD-64-598 SS2]EIW81755.1 hypothetical protein CONPUDRAFT_81496 [Coniophora puteana RWD-64-598 SS2]